MFARLIVVHQQRGRKPYRQKCFRVFWGALRQCHDYVSRVWAAAGTLLHGLL